MLFRSQYGTTRISDHAVRAAEEIVASKGQLVNDRYDVEVFIAALQNADVSPAIYRAVVSRNPRSGKCAVEALLLSRGKDEYALALAELWLTKPVTRAEALMLFSLTPYMSVRGVERLVQMVPPKEPVGYKDGQPVFVHTVGEAWDAVLRLSTQCREVNAFRMKYSEIKSDAEFLKLVKDMPKYPVLVEDVGWILFRHRKQAALDIWEEYKQLSSPAVYRQADKMMLAEFLKHCLLSPESGGSVYEKLRAEVRSQVGSGKDSIAVANALFLLECIAGNEDIEQLKVLAREAAIVSWKERENTRTGPLVALNAVRCIAAIHSTAGLAALEEIRQDSSVDRRAREQAENLLRRRSSSGGF